MTTLHVDAGKLTRRSRAIRSCARCRPRATSRARCRSRSHEYAPVAALTAPDGRRVAGRLRRDAAAARPAKDQAPGGRGGSSAAARDGFESERVRTLVRVLAAAPRAAPAAARARLLAGRRAGSCGRRCATAPTLELGDRAAGSRRQWARPTACWRRRRSEPGRAEIDVRAARAAPVRRGGFARRPRTLKPESRVRISRLSGGRGLDTANPWLQIVQADCRMGKFA